MLNCAFCKHDLPGTGRPAKLAGEMKACPVCRALFTVAPDEWAARAAIAAALEVEPDQVEIVSTAVGGTSYFYCGWSRDELLTPVQIALIVGKSKQTVQQHLREGRFPGARQDDDGLQTWRVPRAGVLVYLHSGRKAYTLSDEGKSTRGRPPKKKKAQRAKEAIRS